MGLMKIVLIVGGVVLGAGAIGGIAAGVVASRKTETGTESEFKDPNNSSSKPSSTTPEKPQEKPTGREMVNDQPGGEMIVDLKVELQKVIQTINENEIIVHPLKSDGSMVEMDKQTQRDSVYAFNIKPNQLSYSKDKDLKEKELSLTLTIDNKKNSVSSLNAGDLTVSLNLKKDGDSSAEATDDLTLKKFKTGSMDLINVVKEPNLEQFKKDFLLTLTPKTPSPAKYISIEDLNKDNVSGMKSGLTTWLEGSDLSLESLQDTTLVGKVKLQKISKGANNTEFLLVSTNENTPLKLTARKMGDGNVVEELLISGIKTTNLLASSVKVVPNEVNTEATTKLVESLKTLNNGDAYEKTGDNLSVKVGVPEAMVSVGVYAYSIKAEADAMVDEIPVGLEVSFGDKQYSTKETETWKELKEAEFGFQIFSKKLDGNEEAVKSTSITNEGNKLTTYFKTTNFTMPVMGSTKNSDKESMENGEFYVAKYRSNTLSTDIKISVKKSSKDNTTDNMLPQNLIVFANYTYKGINESNVLYTPNISLIQVPKTADMA